ncbi:Glycerophosphodiester phosphodiesterase [Lentibacillus sp. JNUCC-1]|uniref:glycerophosphoryl diester phosphodiesterase membrane domain-containing protein n=1 Tax=Lentibacillus sp. JNUCC-1 TaxID=2654513 RepID=UPI0012E804AD|nr:glycerophosphodiester phosphodiesterase family protein [Lentibacillus sp. JNUCC-1]MUV36402.1 Glycerophosphodiester phosphodiesterase [Lentibacillus sp. JNUCC-1]
MFHMFRNSLDDFKRAYPKYLSFEVIYSFLASLIFTPFLSYLFNKLFMMVGRGEALLNKDIYMVGLSYKGVLGLFGISFLAVAVLFVEFGVIIIIAEKSYFKEAVTVSEAFVTAMTRIPKLIGLGIFHLIFLLLLVIPFLDASTLPPILDVNITILIRDLFRESLTAKVFYAAIIAGIAYVYMRWIYTLHFIFIENQSIRKAIRASWGLTRHGKFRLVFTLILWNAIIVVSGFGIVSLISRLSMILDSKVVGDFIGNYLLTASSYIALIMSLFFIPVNMIILTRLFYKSLDEMGMPVLDQLNLKKASFLRRLEDRIGALIKRGKIILISILVLVLTGGFAMNYFINDSIVYLPWDVEVAGHKGDGFSAPENSISSIKSGIQKGVDAVEIDVTLTKDNVLVLSHDQDLRRTAGIPAEIKDLTYEELSKIDIGTPFDEAFAGETIPKLDEVLSLTTETNTRVIIDVKTNIDEDIYASEIVRLVEKHGAAELASVQSFNRQFLKMIRKQNEEIDIGQILYLSAGNLSNMDVDFYTVRESMLTKRFIKHAKRENRKIWVWTVNYERNIKEVLSYDIDGIITDYPEKVQRILGVREAEGETGMRRDKR